MEQSVRHTSLAALETGAVSPESRWRLTKTGPASHTHTGLWPHSLGSHPTRVTASRTEWRAQSPLLSQMLSAITEAAKSHKKAARYPPCVLAGLSLMSTWRSPHFPRSAAAQGWALPGHPKQQPIDLSHLRLQTLPQLGTTWTQVSVSFTGTATRSYTVSVTVHVFYPFSIMSIRESLNICRGFPFSLSLSEPLFISVFSIFYSTFKTSFKMTLTLLLIASALELSQPCWSQLQVTTLLTLLYISLTAW